MIFKSFQKLMRIIQILEENKLLIHINLIMKINSKFKKLHKAIHKKIQKLHFYNNSLFKNFIIKFKKWFKVSQKPNKIDFLKLLYNKNYLKSILDL